ncbi:MAG: ABC transporter substrate-binding protein [Acidimicrobiales bacterium]|nr:ABC transporter substrate-binding protein [Acidimicrobiales bacterium]
MHRFLGDLMRRFRLLAILLGLSLFAAACGGGGDDETRAEQSDATVAEDDDETPSSTPAEPDEPTEDPSTTTEIEELTDSFRGVTSDTIKIGVVIIDVSVIGRSNGDVEAQWQTAIDAVNTEGGILGRSVEPVFAKYSPLGDTESEAACVKLTQDEKVFAAMGPLRSNLTCFSDVNDTIFINTFGVSQEEFDRSSAVVVGPGALPARSAGINVTSLAEAGVLGGAVAVHASADAGGELDVWLAALSDRGIDVVAETQSTVGGGDVVASEAEMQAFAQVWESAGAEAVLAIGAGSGINVVSGIDRGSFRPRLLMTNPSDFDPNIYRDLGYSTDALVDSVAVGFRDFQDLATTGDAGVGDCVSRFEAASGETVNIEPEGDEAVNLNTTIWSCQALDIFSQIARAAGADLTNGSFRSAAETLGPLSVTGAESASISVGKFDIGDGEPLLLTYDETADDFVPLG